MPVAKSSRSNIVINDEPSDEEASLPALKDKEDDKEETEEGPVEEIKGI